MKYLGLDSISFTIRTFHAMPLKVTQLIIISKRHKAASCKRLTNANGKGQIDFWSKGVAFKCHVYSDVESLFESRPWPQVCTSGNPLPIHFAYREIKRNKWYYGTGFHTET